MLDEATGAAKSAGRSIARAAKARLIAPLGRAALGPEWEARVGAAWTAVRAASVRLTEDKRFERFIIALIILNAIVLGLETSEGFMARFGAAAIAVDRIVLAIFVFEIAARIVAQGRAFFRSGWSWFDLIVVGLSFASQVEGMAVLRSLRVLRILRLLSIVPKMRRVLGGFFAAVPGMAGVIGVLSVLFYVSAVIATMTFGAASAETLPEATPEQIETMQVLFGTLPRSLFTLFQLMTLENWVDGIVMPAWELYPNALLFFIPYIVITSFAVLNLFIGIIVDAMNDERDEDLAEERAAAEARHDDAEAAQTALLEDVLKELRDVRAEVAALRADRTPGE